ncbi:hypothetical protein B0H16DRAFT_1682521 [Mycena metata]|uniref:Uncharacterized protein n=1 Tax=Mycena metata TaxID=1033252 RepID=A0AAD7NZ05_9AGAR|nr:hypothetical protein B0H16DRAFT_1682521 [Mycena metata]
MDGYPQSVQDQGFGSQGNNPLSIGNAHQLGSQTQLLPANYGNQYTPIGPTYDGVRDGVGQQQQNLLYYGCTCGARCLCDPASCLCTPTSCTCDVGSQDDEDHDSRASSQLTPQSSQGQNQREAAPKWELMIEQVTMKIRAEVRAEVGPLHDTIKQLQQERSEHRAETVLSKQKKKIHPEIYVGGNPCIGAMNDSHIAWELIKTAMMGLLGMPDAKCDIPGPLGEDEHPRVDEAGVSLFNPTWEGTANGSQPLVIATVNTVWGNENVKRTLAAHHGALDAELKAIVKAAAVQHFSTKQRAYRAQIDPVYKAKLVAKNKGNTIYNHLKRVGATRREMIPELEEKYGAENCVGGLALVQNDWCSEDGSDAGEADPVKWGAAKAASGDPKRAKERRKPEWRADCPDRLYAVLDTLSRQNETEKSFPVGGHHRKSKGRKAGGKDRRKEAFKVDRFRGFAENVLRGPPKKHVPFVSCVNEAWAAENKEYALLPDPPNFTIFNLVIPDSDLDAEALALLGEAGEETGTL